MPDSRNNVPWHEPWSEEEKRIGFLLSRAQKLARLAFDQKMRDLSVTAPQFEILALLLKHEGASSADLARHTALTAQAVNGLIMNLEQRGFIERTPHPVHGRILQTRLTASGREILEECAILEQDIDRKLVAGLDDAQIEFLRKWLINTVRSLRKETKIRKQSG